MTLKSTPIVAASSGSYWSSVNLKLGIAVLFFLTTAQQSEKHILNGVHYTKQLETDQRATHQLDFFKACLTLSEQLLNYYFVQNRLYSVKISFLLLKLL